jgi:hypothetical protein
VLGTGEEMQVAGRYGYVCSGAKLNAVLDLTTGTSAGSPLGSTCVTVLKR